MSEHFKDALGGLIWLAIVLSLFFLAGFAQAGGQTLNLTDGQGLTLKCAGGTIVNNPTSGSTVAWTCQKSAGPPQPEPGPTPPPTTGCPKPNPPVNQSSRMQAGQTLLQLSPHTHAVQFNSSTANKGIDISWGPYSSGGPRALAVSVSQCGGAYPDPWKNTSCTAGAPNGRLFVSTRSGSSVCQLKPNTNYVVNIAAINPVTGKPSCPTGGQCKIAFFVSVQQ